MTNAWTQATMAKATRRPAPDQETIPPGNITLIDEDAGNRTSPELSTTSSQPDYFSPRDEICGAYNSQPEEAHSPSSEARDTRSHPLERAAQTASQVPTMKGNPKNRPLASVQASSSESCTPVSSFIPTGFNGRGQPLGKYYPSNYENRPSRHANINATPSPRPVPTTPAISAPHVPPYRQEPAPARSRSDLERQMRQYQRDMVSQAATAALALVNNGSAPSPKPTASPRRATRPTRIALPGNFRPEGLPDNFNLGGLLNVQLRPDSPRLAPLGSPGGPVTPMNLEDAHGDCYWDRGRGTPGSSAGYQARIRV